MAFEGTLLAGYRFVDPSRHRCKAGGCGHSLCGDGLGIGPPAPTDWRGSLYDEKKAAVQRSAVPLPFVIADVLFTPGCPP